MEEEFEDMPGPSGGPRWRAGFDVPFGARGFMAGVPFPGPMPHVMVGPPFGRHRRRRGRVRRGAIRAGVLLVLADGPRHGYEVMTELADRSGGMWRPSPGSVYPTLQQLEDEDLVRSEEVDHKRIFRLTDAGKGEAEQVAARGAPWSTVTDGLTDEQRALHQAAFQLSAAVMQVAQAGSPEQVSATQALLDDARKSVYRLLAEDSPPQV